MAIFKNKKVVYAYLLVCFIWGSTYLAIRIGVTNFPPLLFAGTRNITAGLLMFLYVTKKGFSLPQSKKEFFKISLAGVILLTAANGAVVVAEQWVESGFIALIIAINPVMILLIESFILKKSKVTGAQFASVLLGLVGVLLLLSSDSKISTIPTIGIVLSLIAPLLWSIGSIYASGTKLTAHIYSVSAIQLFAGGVGQLIIAFFLKQHHNIPSINSKVILSWLYLVFFGSIIAYSAYQYIIKNLPASIAATSTYVNPVVALFLGAIFLKEDITVLTVVAATIILASVILLGRLRNKKSKTVEGTCTEL